MYRWVFAAVLFSLIIRRLTNWNPVLAGLTGAMGLRLFWESGEPSSDMGLCLVWIGMLLFMIYKKITVLWPSAIFLTVYMSVSGILGGEMLWVPQVFCGAVTFFNDYRNGGKDSFVHRIFAVIAALLCACLNLLLPVEFALCLGLFAVNIIACNLSAYTL